MTMRILSHRLSAQSALPQTARPIPPDRSLGLRPFSVCKPVAAALVATLLLGVTLPIAQHAGAQVQSARGWIERATTPGDESTTMVLDDTELPPGAPIIAVDEISVAYDPTAQEQIEPYDPHAGEQTGR